MELSRLLPLRWVSEFRESPGPFLDVPFECLVLAARLERSQVLWPAGSDSTEGLFCQISCLMIAGGTD